MESYSLVFNDSFWTDVDDALDWYDNISAELSVILENEILKYCNKLAKNPKANARVDKTEYRRILLHKFPFKIYYRIELDIVYITTLIHTSRSNKFISKKLK